jgi:cobalt/nickel transport system permease protein
MHIMEGFLPHPWWEIWFVFSLPVVAYGVKITGNLAKDRRDALPLLAVAGAFIFVLSSLKLPSMTGSSSHPTGTGLDAIFFGPAVTSVVSTVVLIYQALFLAHGGITTLGANVFSMGIAGPAMGYAAYKGTTKLRLNLYVAVFLSAFTSDLATYLTTALQLAMAFPAAMGVWTSFQAFATVFAITQIPLAAMEGVVTVFIFRYLLRARSDALVRLKIISGSSTKPVEFWH